MQYKKTAKARAFQPVQAIDYTQGLQQEEQRQQRSRNLNMEIASENAEVNQKNLGRVGNIDDRFTRNLEALSQFSNTLAETLVEDQKRINKEEEAAGLNQAFMDQMNGAPDPNREEFDVREGALRAADAVIDDTAIDLSKQGVGYGAIQKLREMSGWRAYGYAQGLAQMAGDQYGSYLEQQMMRDDLNFTDPTGASFTPQTAKGSQRLQAISTIRQAYIAERGLAQLNGSLVSKYAFPSMMRAESYYNREAGRREAEAARQTAILEAETQFNAEKSYPNLVRRLAATNNGNYYDAHNSAIEFIKKAVAAGVITRDDVKAMGEQPDPVTGQPIAERYKTRWQNLLEFLDSEEIKDWNRAQRQREELYREAKREAMAMDPTTLNEEEIVEIDKRLRELNGGRPDPDFASWARAQNRRGRDIQADRERLDGLLNNSLLTMQDVMDADPSLREEYGNKLRNLGNVGELFPLKQITKQFTELVKARPLAPNEEVNPVISLIANRLTSDYLLIRGRLLSVDKISAKDAHEQAMLQVSQKFNIDRDQQTSIYWEGNNSEFPNFTKKVNADYRTGITKFEEQFRHANELYKRFGISFLDEGPDEMGRGALFTTKELIDMQADFQKPYFQPPSIVSYYADTLNMHPLDILNRIRKAHGLEELLPLAYVEEKGLDEDVQSLLRRYPSPVRAQRAWGQTGKFNEAIVPLQLGPVIAEKSALHGVDPAIVAGILEAENSGMDGIPNWRTDATSPMGAEGIAQFMPGTAAELGVDPWNVESAIDGAARYVKLIQDQWAAVGVILTPEQIAMMYNAGPNLRLEDYPYGQENSDYRTKFLRGFSKYGGGQGYWSSPQSMRPTFAEQYSF